MSQPTPKIEFFRIRGAGEKITATLDFLRENRKAWLMSCAWPIIPFCLVLGWVDALQVNFLYYDYGDTGLPSYDLPRVLFGFSLSKSHLISVESAMILVLFWVLYTATGAMMYLYEHRDGRLQGVTWVEWRQAIARSAFCSVIMAVVSLLVLYVLSSQGLAFILAMLLLAVTIPLALFVPANIIGRGSGLGVSWRALSLGFSTWGGLVATGAGLMLIMSFLRGVAEVMVTLLHGMIVNLSYAYDLSPMASHLFTAFSMACCYWVSFLCLSILMIGAGYLYGHAEEKFTLISLDEDIRHFEDL